MWEFRRNPERYESLKRLPARDAIAKFLAGEFAFGEETALAEAVRKGLSLPMSLDAVVETSAIAGTTGRASTNARSG